jgi:hypothetical protein
MTPELPIACLLDNAEMEQRSRRWERLADRALIEATLRPGGVAVQRYRNEPEVRDELEELIRLEGDCCGFLDFKLSGSDDELALEISGPEGSEEIVAGFAGEPTRAG